MLHITRRLQLLLQYIAADINYTVFIRDREFNVRWLEINLLRQYYSWFNYKYS